MKNIKNSNYEIRYPKPVLKEFIKDANQKVLNRAYNMFNSNEVNNVEIHQKYISAQVGKNAGYTKITWDDITGKWDYGCDCNYHWIGPCDHVVALAFWVDHNCVYLEKGVLDKRRLEVTKIIKDSDDLIKNDFLLEVLINDNNLLNQFKAKSKKLDIRKGRKTIEKLKLEYSNFFNSMNLRNIDSDFICSDSFEIEDNSFNQNVEKILKDFKFKNFDNIIKHVSQGKIMEAVSNYIAMSEAIKDFLDTIEDDEDEFSFYDPLESFIIFIDFKVEQILTAFSDVAISLKAQELILDNLQKKADSMSEKYLVLLLITIEFNQKFAYQIIDIVQNCRLDSASSLKIKYVKFIDDKKMQDSIYEIAAYSNDLAANILLDKYKDNKKEYHRVAKNIVNEDRFDLNKKIIMNLDFKFDPELFRKTALILFRDSADINYYRMLKNADPLRNIDQIIDELEDYDEDILKFSIMVEENLPHKAYEFYANGDRMLPDNYALDYLIQHFPLKCYNLITQKVLEMLQNFSSRDKYGKAADLLLILLDIPDDNIKERGLSFIKQFCLKHKKRKAMLEVFRDKGISC